MWTKNRSCCFSHILWSNKGVIHCPAVFIVCPVWLSIVILSHEVRSKLYLIRLVRLEIVNQADNFINDPCALFEILSALVVLRWTICSLCRGQNAWLITLKIFQPPLLIRPVDASRLIGRNLPVPLWTILVSSLSYRVRIAMYDPKCHFVTKRRSNLKEDVQFLSQNHIIFLW